MYLDSRKFDGKCECGCEHEMFTRFAVIEEGALKNIEEHLKNAGISGKRCVLYGENSYKATSDRHPAADEEIILASQGLHADEKSTAEVLGKLGADVQVLIAVGSGTIHDIARYCASQRKIQFVSCPTAASVDGFCSTMAAMIWYGYKTTFKAAAPIIVIADTEIIRDAPIRLVRSGVGDIMAKYIALAEWKIANTLTGEHFCPQIYNIMKNAVDDVMANVEGILKGYSSSYESVTYSLIMSGIAMQMMGNSRPASGAEHHISHMIEMKPQGLHVEFDCMHGEKTGVGTIYAAREYKRLAKLENIALYVVPFKALEMENIKDFFGEKLAEGVMKENENDCLSPVSCEKIADNWQRIREIIGEIPASDKLENILIRLGAKHTLEDIGVRTEELQKILQYSPMVRGRLTLMRAKRMIKY